VLPPSPDPATWACFLSGSRLWRLLTVAERFASDYLKNCHAKSVIAREFGPGLCLSRDIEALLAHYVACSNMKL